MQIIHRPFAESDLVGGHHVLDFVNTAPGRDASPRDWLDGYPRLLEWAALSGAASEPTLKELAALAEREPAQAAAALDRARELREALFQILSGLVLAESPPASALDLLHSRWAEAAAASRLTLVSGGLRPEPALAGLDRIGAQLALDAVDLLQQGPGGRLKLCEGHDCAWLFLDTSKNGRRRWCSMSTCGNTAKARRHYQRRRAAVADPA